MCPAQFFQDAHRRLPNGYGLRPRAESDLAFLSDLYANTREEELAPVPWPAAQKQAFLSDQFDKQHRQYLQHYPRAHWWIITCDGVPVGRLYVEQAARELRVMDVSLLAAHRKKGVGGALIQAVLEHADRDAIAVSLHVEPFNPALRLYQRLGFSPVEMRGIYLFMQRQPSVEGRLVSGRQ